MSTGMKALLIGLILTATTGSAFAAAPYISFEGGISRFHDADLKVAGAPTTTATYDSGYGFAAAAGYKLEPVRLVCCLVSSLC